MPLHKNLTGPELHYPLGRASAGSLLLEDDLSNAYQIAQGSDNQFNISTINGTEEITFGNGTQNPDFTFSGTGLFTSGGGHKYKTATLTGAGSAHDLANESHVLFIDTSSGTEQLNLPTASQVTDQIFLIIDKESSFGTNNLVIHRAGSELIDNTSADKTISDSGARLWLFCDGTNWFTFLDGASQSGGAASAEPVLVEVHNATGSTLSKGKAVYVSGTHASGKPQVTLADADGSGTVPAIGLIYSDILDGADGNVAISGTLSNLNTSAYSAGDILYLSATAGDLTITRPTTDAEKVQNVGFVTRSHASSGSLVVLGSGRTNDIPNDLVTLTGVTLGSSNLGTFTGTTITDSSSVKTALQELETAVESAGGGGYTVQAKDANFTAAADYYYVIDTATNAAAITVTLPDAAGVASGKTLGFKVQHGASFSVTLDRSAGGNIDGAASNLTISTDMAAVELIADGTDFWIKG